MNVSEASKRQVLGSLIRRRGLHWTPAMDAVLGTCDDVKAARSLGVARYFVIHRRQDLGIPPCPTS